MESGPTGLLMDCPCGKGEKCSVTQLPGRCLQHLGTWEASPFHSGMGEEERSGKKNIFAPKASQEPRFDPPTYTGELVWPALWGRGSNDPGNVAKTHYLLHNPIGHLVTVLREDLQANGPLLHPVMLVRVKVCLFWIFPPYLILAM